jgi:ABC-type transport system involved in cytochrome bd biosynthesis fused ATPase/permease subunit
VPPPESPTDPAATFERTARLVGVAQALIAIIIALQTALGVAQLATDSVPRGLALLAGALAERWVLTTLVEEWNESAARQIRSLWRARLSSHLERPRRAGEHGRGDLALAVDRVARTPALGVIGSSARSAVIALVAVFLAAGWLSTSIVVALLAISVPLYQRAGRRSEALEAEYQARRSLLEARQLELLHHAPELRALGGVEYGADEIAAISDSEHAIALRAIRVTLGSSLVTEFLSGVSIGLVAMVVGFELLGGRISLVRALVAVLVTSELFGFVRRYGVEFHRRDEAGAAASLLARGLAMTAAAPSAELVEAHDLVTSAGTRRVSLRVRAGDRLLVTGPSGAGKTTLLHTLVGWRSPREGEVRRGATHIGFVSAESSLFAGTLAQNLTLGADLEDQVVRDVLHRLGLSGPRFEDLSAPLLADGRGLSAGERVRLVLARALLARPQLVVIDDIAGVLDDEARNQVRDVLAAERSLAVIEATVDTPLVADATLHVTVGP